MSTRFIVSGLVAALACAWTGPVEAAPALRVQVDQHGDFLLIGNTLGIECDVGTPAPVVGTITAGACNQLPANVTDSAPDLLWRSDSPGAGQANADLATTPAQARSTAVLSVPPGASVTHAFLYWAAKNVSGMGDLQVTVDRPGAGGFSQVVNAVQTFVPGVNSSYQSVADVTALVQTAGSGPYRVSDIDVEPFANVNDNAAFGGWSMVVLYQRAGDPLRNLAVFDGLDVVASGMNQTLTLSGFLVPNAGYDGKLGVIAYEGDNAIPGDQLFFGNGGVPLSDAQNPPDNFFNGTRSYLGSAVSVAGDLPQLTGTAQSMAGLDLDVVDVTAKLMPGQTSVQVQATSTGDVYYLGCFITSVSTFRPDFTTSTKSVTDVNGGTVVPGDVLTYTIVVTNTGNDASKNTVLTDPLPNGVTYVPGTLQINAAAQTDAAGDDEGEYTAATRTVTTRLGAGATSAIGGSIAIGGSATVTFQVTVDAGVVGSIANQGVISASGQLGAPQATTPTDGNGPVSGSPPTTTVVNQCATNAQCAVPTPVCNTTPSPAVCVQCLQDSDCGGPMSGKVCNGATDTCVNGCRGMGGNGCPAGDVCTSPSAVIGQCVQCLADSDCGGPTSGTVCNAATSTCQAGCRGMGGNGCPLGLDCTSPSAVIGQCVQCLQDSDCGGSMSGKVCNAASSTCEDGCRGMGGNGCPLGQDCTSMNAMIGQCVQCLQDSDCGGPMSGKVCDATTSMCASGCRGAGGNGCPTGDVCSSMDMTIGACVQCVKDSDCGGGMSGKVCDATTSLCADGCRGTGGNGCPTGDVCSSADMTVGTCVQCVKDSNCGGETSGKVCDATTMMCADGCRGTMGNGCPSGEVCTSADTTIGQCIHCTKDGDCGSTTSGQICNPMTSNCVPGCRGTDGNGCPGGDVCTSKDATPGTCVACVQDGDCGSASSGRICDVTTNTCGNGCRGTGGNGCPNGEVCTSKDATVGTCTQCVQDSDCGAMSGLVCEGDTCVPGCRKVGGAGCPDGETCVAGDGGLGWCSKGFVAEGNGILCEASPGSGETGGAAWVLPALAALLGLRRRRR